MEQLTSFFDSVNSFLDSWFLFLRRALPTCFALTCILLFCGYMEINE